MEWVLLYSGVVRAKEKPNRLYPFIVAFTYINLLADFCTTFIYVFEDHPFDDKIEAIQCAISFIHLIGKIANLKLRRSTFWRLINDSRQLWKEMAEVKENEQILIEQR